MPFDTSHAPDFFETARSIVSPPAQPLAHFVELERRADANRQAIQRAEADRASGVCFSGMAPEPFPSRSEGQLHQDAADRLERLEAYRASPIGRFNSAAKLIYRATGDCRLLDCASRSLAVSHQRAASLLSHMSGPAADECREALADFLRDQKTVA